MFIFSHKGQTNGIGVCLGAYWNLFGENAVRDADFYDLVTMLDQAAGQTHGNEPHINLVEQVRTHFPARQAGRYRPLASDLLAAQEDETPLYKISPRYEDNDFNSKFGEARRGNDKRFRALLLKWLWARHRGEAEAYFTRWGVQPPADASQQHLEFHLTPSEIFDALPPRKLSRMAYRNAISPEDFRRSRALREKCGDESEGITADDMRFLARLYSLVYPGQVRP